MKSRAFLTSDCSLVSISRQTYKVGFEASKNLIKGKRVQVVGPQLHSAISGGIRSPQGGEARDDEKA